MTDRNWLAVEHDNSAAFDVDAHGEPSRDIATAGAVLRHARENAGLHIGALAVSLKVPVKKLEALESDRLDLLPDVVFARALALSVCRALKVEANPVLERLPQCNKTLFKNDAAASINAPFRVAGKARSSRWGQASRRSVVAGLLLLSGALALIIFPTLSAGLDSVRNSAVFRSAVDAVYGWPVFRDSLSNQPADRAVVPTADAHGSDTAFPAQQLSLKISGGASSTSTEAAFVAPIDLASESLVDDGASSAPVTLKPSLTSSAGSSAPEVIVFTAKRESWVEVTDARGRIVLRRTLATGEAAGVSGVLPLAAVVGRADATLVQVRGIPLELTPYARNNVARFEVK